MFIWALSLASSVAVAVLVLVGHYQRERRLTQRLRDVDELKRRLYELVEICAEYWSIEHLEGVSPPRQVLEAKVLATKLIVSSQCRNLRLRSKRLRKWHTSTLIHRMRLWDKVTGGCFQQAEWEPDPNRVPSIAREVGHMVGALNRAC